MEVAVRVLRLNLLLILVFIFVFQGLCAVPEIGKRQFPFDILPEILPDILPDIRPIPDDPVPPDIPGDPVPPGDGGAVPIILNPGSGSNGLSPLGEYIDNNYQAPFSGTVQYSALPAESTTALTEG